MKKPTFEEFKEAVYKAEAEKGTKQHIIEVGNISVIVPEEPTTDVELLKMWAAIQSEPRTGVYYHGEITTLT
jgi:hypothetical protein